MWQLKGFIYCQILLTLSVVHEQNDLNETGDEAHTAQKLQSG